MACVADYYHTTHNISFTASALITLCGGKHCSLGGGEGCGYQNIGTIIGTYVYM